MSQEFSIDLPIQAVFDPSTLTKLTACHDTEDAKSVAHVSPTLVSKNIDWDQEIAPVLVGKLPSSHKSPKKMTAFLTGANGFLGVYLCKEILERGSFQEIVCLVRGKDDDEAKKRFDEAAKQHHLTSLLSSPIIRIVQYEEVQCKFQTDFYIRLLGILPSLILVYLKRLMTFFVTQ